MSKAFQKSNDENSNLPSLTELGEDGAQFKASSLSSTLYDTSLKDPEDTPPPSKSHTPLTAYIWKSFSIVLLLLFALSILIICAKAWLPQDLSDIKGYQDKEIARDIQASIRNSPLGAIQFSEAEINRYLRDTCRMRQAGVLSLFSHPGDILMRIHDGYAEIIIERKLGAGFSHTVSLHLSFKREKVEGKERITTHFKGGAPLIGSIPRGGRIGSLPIPQSYTQMLIPAMRELLELYPDVEALVSQKQYLPQFVKKSKQAEGYVRFTPPSQPIISTT